MKSGSYATLDELPDAVKRCVASIPGSFRSVFNGLFLRDVAGQPGLVKKMYAPGVPLIENSHRQQLKVSQTWEIRKKCVQ